MRTQVPSLALLSGLRIWLCGKPWCRSQRQLKSRVAMAVAGSCSSNSAPTLRTSICHRCGPTKVKKKRKKKSQCLMLAVKACSLDLTPWSPVGTCWPVCWLVSGRRNKGLQESTKNESLMERLLRTMFMFRGQIHQIDSKEKCVQSKQKISS